MTESSSLSIRLYVLSIIIKEYDHVITTVVADVDVEYLFGKRGILLIIYEYYIFNKKKVSIHICLKVANTNNYTSFTFCC